MGDTQQETSEQANWDMSSYFSAPLAKDYTEFCGALSSDMSALASDMPRAPKLAADTCSTWSALLLRLEDASSRAGHLTSYLECMGAADSRNEVIKKESAALATTLADLDKLYVAARAALGECEPAVFASLEATEELGGAQYFVRRLRTEAHKSMSPELEGLQADLGVNGISAWGRLYDQVSGTLEFSLEVPGEKAKALPVSMTRSLLEDSNPAVRNAAFDGAAQAWDSVGDTVAACLNAISGTRHTLYGKRDVGHFLDPALFDAGISKKTLDCMFEVVRSRQSLPQAYLVRKAKILGIEKLGFSDLMAPMPSSETGRLSWQEGADVVQTAFEASYPNLAALSKRAFDERWIDYSPRAGKRPGGFCSGSQVIGQSRIFMTFNGGMGDVQTLAHELGHSFHSYLMRDMRPWAADYPMTLAETASTFAENVVTSAALEDPATSRALRIAILDQRLQDSSSFLLNIPMRFDFECALYEARKDGELSVGALKNLMLDAQRKNYGDSLDPKRLDPWFWASKLHFYITELSFYNFPYTFGYLFSLGIFAQFLREGEAFIPRYEELLRQTGSASAEEVAAKTLGVDLEQPEFWNASIDLIAKDWESFQGLTES
ncbi:MAG: M3 family oligoendopeptidase [Myxococcales bacterium]|nr:M3 family oligoendopeptidase [Myxococcales bacterium]